MVWVTSTIEFQFDLIDSIWNAGILFGPQITQIAQLPEIRPQKRKSTRQKSTSLRNLFDVDRNNRPRQRRREDTIRQAREIRGLRPEEEEEANMCREAVQGGAELFEHERLQELPNQGLFEAPLPHRPQLQAEFLLCDWQRF